MRKSSFGLAMVIAVILTMVVPAVAADVQQGATDLDCKKGEEIAVWHFVANQTEGIVGKLVLTFPDDSTVVLGPTDKHNKNYTNQQWWVRGPADAIKNAQTQDLDGNDLPGKLVISDAYCESIKK